ncbi:protein disulfide isomerase-like 1-6 isoform X2 [Pistacia vera]|uniref:protein disulfide isomerase-like 1-6 isoform X2 n=1 Tax=Pistacia vera TaxID=55513 RepID=UPI00126305CF|nr:protein disulfide isomerase-like 1-6 isoform X2 [Pistacia vera]
MFPTKATSRFIFFTFTLLLLVSFFTTTLINASDLDTENDDKVDKDLEELIALDEQEEDGSQVGDADAKFSEAELLSKAQRIVLELNSDNAKRVAEGNEFVLLLGYAPWCARSAELMPQFAEAATSLKELKSPLLMAKIDAERYSKAASSLGIKGFPTLLLFVNGTSQAYTGGFSAAEIVIWARKKTGVPVIRINTVKAAEEFLKKYPMFVLGKFDKFEGPDYEEFLKAATSDNEIQFVETSSSEVARVLYPDIKATNHFLGLVKSEPVRYTEFDGAFEMDKILQFLEYNKFPLVIKLTEINNIKVYASPINLQVFVFAKADELKGLHEPLQNVARKFKGKVLGLTIFNPLKQILLLCRSNIFLFDILLLVQIIFISVDSKDENLAKPFLTILGLEESENTVVTAFDTKISSKFLLESDPTESNIEEFCSRLLHGTLSPYFKSQPIPDNTDASVKIIVGKTFDDLVLGSPENVLLEVHTPWCINCETTSKQMEKLAKHFKGLDNLVFAKIDAAGNEHPKLQVDDYPTLLFYPADDKANPIKLPTKQSSKDLASFINKQLKDQDQGLKDEL